MAKAAVRERPTFRCAECGWLTAKWVGRCGECQAWGTRGRRHRTRGPYDEGRPGQQRGPADRRGRRRGRRGPCRPGSTSSTGCSAAAWCRAPWCCWPASPGSASRPCCSTWPRGSPSGLARCTSPARSPPPRCGCGPTGSARCATSCSWPPRPTWPRCSATSTRSSPTCSSSTRCRPSPARRSTASPGGVSQVREVAAALIRVAKERGIATVLVGHVTKDGSIAGPRLLEHLVDVVLHFEGDRHSRLRHGARGQEPLRPGRRGGLLRPVRRRHRRAAPTRAGCSCPSSAEAVPGTCVTVTRRGPAAAGRRGAGPGRAVAAQPPRRTTSGLDGGRLAMVLAVLQRAAEVQVGAARRLRLDRRRGAADRAGRPTWRSRWRSPARRRTTRWPPGWSRSARSAWPARSGGSPAPRAGSPRPRGSASPTPWCRPTPARCPAGIEAIEVRRPRARAAGGLPGRRGDPVRQPAALTHDCADPRTRRRRDVRVHLVTRSRGPVTARRADTLAA